MSPTDAHTKLRRPNAPLPPERRLLRVLRACAARPLTNAQYCGCRKEQRPIASGRCRSSVEMLVAPSAAPSATVAISRFQDTIDISLAQVWPVNGCVLQTPPGQTVPSTAAL